MRMLLRLFRTVNFRLTAIYVALFALSVLLFDGIVFFSIRSALEQQLQRQIENQTGQLMIEYQDDGLEDLRDAIRDTIKAATGPRLRYFLQAPSGKIIFDDLDVAIAPPYGWQQVMAPDGHALLLQSTKLGDDYVLGVAAELTPIEETEQTLLSIFLWAFLAVLGIGIMGGILLSRRFLAQVDAITCTAEAIGAAHLDQRIPLRDTGDDLDHLAATINHMLDRIQQLVGDVQRVSSNIAHDLRTPLAHLQQRLEALHRHPLSPELETELQAAEAQLEEVLAIFAAVLRIAEIDSGTQKAHFGPVNLSAVMAQVASAFAPSAEESGHVLTSEIPADLSVAGDKQLLMQLFANLLGNALHHTPAESRVTLALRQEEGVLVVVVADNGPGVPDTLYAEIFKPFYRLEQSRHTPGSGLGLSLVAAIARLHQAEIKVGDNQPGLKVTLRFPIYRS